METIKSTNTTQEVTTMKNEKHCVKVESIVRGISTVLFFEDAREARGFADELDAILLRNSCLFEVSMIWGADAYTLVRMPIDKSERELITIIDHDEDCGNVTDLTVASCGEAYYITEALNAVFTGTTFEAYAGDYAAYVKARKKNNCIKVTNVALGLAATLSFENVAAGEDFASYLDECLNREELSGISISEQSDVADYLMVYASKDTACLTIIDTEIDYVDELYIADAFETENIVQVLNAVFTNTRFHAYAGKYADYCKEDK